MTGPTRSGLFAASPRGRGSWAAAVASALGRAAVDVAAPEIVAQRATSRSNGVRGLTVIAFVCLSAASVRAQEVWVGVEARRDRIRYHFDNPSSADTSFLVPHFFEQTYDADNLWLVTAARYNAGVRWETRAGATPRRTVRADDYDTFFDPGNVVVVSGTTGGASMQSFEVSQLAEVGGAGPVHVSIGYRMRWDRFDFHLGHKTVSRNGVLVESADVTSPETTDSKVHEFPVALRAEARIGAAWRLALSGEMSPLTLARLSVQLPEKYPGQDLVFFAKVFASSARVVLMRAGARRPIEVAVQADRTWNYRSTERLSRSAQSVALSVGRRW